nr:thiamine diphosphokinase [Alkalibacter mobilis]
MIANGPVDDTEFYKKLAFKEEFDIIICADGGGNNARKIGIVPDLVIGDLDSISSNTKQEFIAQGVRFEKHPIEKDETDTELALQRLVDSGCDEIVMIGCTGGRFDHTMANVFLLIELAKKNIHSKIVDEQNEIQIAIKSTKIFERKGSTISLIPISDTVAGITLKGFKYPLKNENLYVGLSRGISNIVVDNRSEIVFEKGILMLVYSED